MNIRDSKDAVTTTLGLQWNSTEDILAVPATPPPLDYPITKRNVLKIATVFDPLGLVSPFIVQAKIMLQELWNRGYDWDEEVQDEVANRIQLWFLQLSSLANVKIPCCLQNQQPVKLKEVVTFVDASQQAYGASSYLQIEYEDGTVTSRLIDSKSKVAPLTPMTIPRLELMGAIVGLRLTQSISRTLRLLITAQLCIQTALMYYSGFVGEEETSVPLSEIALEKYKLVLNQLSGSTFPPMKIQQIHVPEE